jgi:glycosyltransferase involved in cell wall biosynthesis
MKISVIVPAYNEEKLIVETLRSIQASFFAFSELGWETELVVCDNNSTDRTAELARQAGAQVVFEPVNQIARARNTGARAASGDWLIFIDADSHPSAALFADVARAIQSGRCLAGGSTVHFDTHIRWARHAAITWNWISRTMKYVAGSFIFCEATAFRKLGGFNLKLYVSEEIELSRRLKKLARKTGKSINILHDHPLVTSARKIHLYSIREYLLFLGFAALKFGKSIKDPKACFPWYDGRR